MTFRRNLLKVARDELTGDDFRAVRRASLRPMVLVALHKELVFQGIACGAIPPQAGENLGDIDWDRLLDFLRELLPMILEFLKALLILF